MKKHKSGLWIAAFMASLTLAGGWPPYLGAVEIDLEDNTTAAPTAAPKPPAPTPTPLPAATPTPAAQTILLEDNTQPETQVAPEPTPTMVEIHGVLKMRDVYEAGIKSYNEQDYDQSIRYLTKAVQMKDDPYTQKFYYAEAYAMLGIIYQFHIIHLGRAYRYYKAALHYEPGNRTARKHIKEVYKYRNRKD